MTTRWKITIEYDGQSYVGWQRQDNGASIQQSIEEALVKLTGEAPTITAAGRTDAGVHALGQVAHFDLTIARSPKAIRDGLNFHLRPHPIVILDAEVVAADFNARMSAIERQYLYRILARPAPSCLRRQRVWHHPFLLDWQAMDEAAKILEGYHDFSTFRASECQAKSPLRTLDELRVRALGDEIQIFARARSFLHHQIRNIAGSLALVGRGKWTKEDLKSALDACDRTKGGPTAPPEGLYFLKVNYVKDAV